MNLLYNQLLLAAAILGAALQPARAIPEGGTQYPHFVAMNETMTCVEDKHAIPFNNQVRGVNLGGWMVLEPWITPSLFYQFLGQTNQSKIGMDTYTFCEVLGPKEANRQLRRHWETWVTEDIIEQLAKSGINSLRVPVGDYMYKPYGPYVDGCFDGALEYVDTMLDWAYANGLTVLLDIHTMKDSQNGFDNSGQAMGFQWTTSLNSEYITEQTFEHWPIRDARWIGTFDQEKAEYSSINYENIQHSLEVIEAIVQRYKTHPAVQALEPVNEPWQYTPIEVLKRFYWEGYLIVKKHAPYWKYIMHDSFRLDPSIWGGFMAGCPERALDTHIYQAWKDPDSRIGFFNDACRNKQAILALEQEFGPVIVGEWSLATDNCAMWLNGFNDNLPGFPRSPCKYIPCAAPYMGEDYQPGAPVDPTKPMQGPYGTGMSGPSFGLCPVGRDWIKESNPLTGRDWVESPPRAPRGYDDTDNVMMLLAYKKISAYSGVGHGFYFWNFRTDLNEPHWSYMLAVERGWMPQGNFNDPRIQNACRNEDQMAYKCYLKHDMPEQNVLKAIDYILSQKNETATVYEKSVLDMKGDELNDAANDMIADYFDDNKVAGITCDFGGIAMLVEENKTMTDETFIDWDVAYFGIVENKGLNWWQLTLVILLGSIFGAAIGFAIGMRFNKKFNTMVRKSTFGRRMTSSGNDLLKNTLSLSDFSGLDLDDLDDVGDYDYGSPEHAPLRG
mmetsp:Transcript_1390/g.3205  ORF Transcript_1390/g.3205 Transcript_1390/m.3205 type:complete len:726 (-) Transcript_1390:311-2488(-)